MQSYGITMEGVIEKEDIEKRIEDLFEEELQLRDICVCEYSICTVKEMEDLIHGAVGFVRDRLLDMIESCTR